MQPAVELIAAPDFNWVSLRATLDKALDLRPDIPINLSPLDFTLDAQLLLYLAMCRGYDIARPEAVLRELPDVVLRHLHYTFMCAADFRIEPMYIACVQKDNIAILTGSLTQWRDELLYKLIGDWADTFDKRYLCNCIQLTLEKERGLELVFQRHTKVPCNDGTFQLSLSQHGNRKS